MTIDELIKELQNISDSGKGSYEVVDGDRGESISDLMIWDEPKTVSI